MSVTIVRPEDRKLESIHPDEPDHPNAAVYKHLVSGDDPYVHIIEVPPGHEVPSHSHSEPEVTVVLSGTLVSGDTACGPGTVLIVPADEAYAFNAGTDEPLRFLVTRPRPATNDMRG